MSGATKTEGPGMNQLRKRKASEYESDRYQYRGVAATDNGRCGSHITRWLVIDKLTGRVVASGPSLSWARSYTGEAAR